jgi:nitric oxide dioxygenase
MTLAAEDIARLRASFHPVTADPAGATALFYAHLFGAAPHLRALFAGDMEVQGGKLATMLGAVVAGIDDWETLVPAVDALGRRHAGYGVRAEDYGPVGAALLRTLADAAGGALDPETEAAWGRAYAALSARMAAA